MLLAPLSIEKRPESFHPKKLKFRGNYKEVKNLAMGSARAPPPTLTKMPFSQFSAPDELYTSDPTDLLCKKEKEINNK